jgi:hypothetical protein
MIKQRLKQMMVVPVDYRHVGIGPAKSRGRRQSAKPGADDDNPRLV